MHGLTKLIYSAIILFEFNVFLRRKLMIKTLNLFLIGFFATYILIHFDSYTVIAKHQISNGEKFWELYEPEVTFIGEGKNKFTSLVSVYRHYDIPTNPTSKFAVVLSQHGHDDITKEITVFVDESLYKKICIKGSNAIFLFVPLFWRHSAGCNSD